MISSAEQYRYVTGADVDEAHPHGDLDRILIDGGIMPKRTGDTGKTDKDGNAIPRQNILRGEDIAYLMEMQLRLRNDLEGLVVRGNDEYVSASAVGSYATVPAPLPAHEFTRVLSKSQLSYVHDLILQTGQLRWLGSTTSGVYEESSMFIRFAKEFPYSTSPNAEDWIFQRTSGGGYYQPYDDRYVQPSDFGTFTFPDGGCLLKSAVSGMFSDMAVAKYVEVRLSGGNANLAKGELDVTRDEHVGSVTWNDNAVRHGWFSHVMNSAGANDWRGVRETVAKAGVKVFDGVDAILARGTFDRAHFAVNCTLSPYASGVGYGGCVIPLGDTEDGTGGWSTDAALQGRLLTIAKAWLSRAKGSLDLWEYAAGQSCSVAVYNVKPMVVFHIKGQPS